MSDEFQSLSAEELASISLGYPSAVERLRHPARFEAQTGFIYPGKGSVLVYIVSDGATVRFSEGGRLLAYLESQGMDLTIDPVLSKTVFHALKETPGCAAANGEVYLESSPEQAGQDLWRFLQVLLEIIGIRHSKYKDALVQLTRKSDLLAAAGWEEPPR